MFKQILVTLTCLLLPNTVLSSMADSSTGLSFVPKLNNLDITGVGVRKKGPIKIYSVGMYTTPSLKESLTTIPSTEKKKALDAIRSGAGSSRPVSFLLKMNFKVGAEKMASAIAESVEPRYSSSDKSNVSKLKDLIFQGLVSKGSLASKGTTFEFDCGQNGVTVSVDGKSQGSVQCPELSKAFCGIYLDDKTVSPKLLDNCIENWCSP